MVFGWMDTNYNVRHPVFRSLEQVGTEADPTFALACDNALRNATGKSQHSDKFNAGRVTWAFACKGGSSSGSGSLSVSWFFVLLGPGRVNPIVA
jgi:hypothetical protein